MNTNIEQLTRSAMEGDKASLERLVGEIQGRIFNLAVRMLGHPEDAEDASQEILIKVVTHLADYRGESAFTTWVYRIAVNHVLSSIKKRNRQEYLTFDAMIEEIDRGMAWESFHHATEPELGLRVEEMMVSCTQGMLMCLDRDLRVAYVLGEIFQVSGEQGGYILDISHDAFRKRLSRARKKLYEFMREHCSLVNPESPCTCRHHVLLRRSRKNKPVDFLPFTGRACQVRRLPEVMNRLRELDELKRVAAVFHNHPDYTAPEIMLDSVREIIGSGHYELIEGHC